MAVHTLDRIRAIPKVELHVHLDTSLSYRTMQRILPGLTEKAYRLHFVAPARCAGLPDFLRRVQPCIEALQTPDALAAAMQGLVRDLREDGVIYAEVRFAPLLHLRGGLSAREVAVVCCEAFAEAKATYGLEGGLLFCTLRHFTARESRDTARLALAFRDRGVLGFDLAGDELQFGLEVHLPAFELIGAEGMPYTLHLGEARGAAHMREALDTLSPRRLGHGVRCVEDAALMAALREAGIHLEVCPGSNIQVGVFTELASHPVNLLYREGLRVGINTDGRGLTATTLTQEYHDLQATFGWGMVDFNRVNRMAMNAAFCEEAVRTSMLTRLSESAP